MDENNKVYDLFAARMLNPDKGIGALIDNGITIENTTLKSIDEYRDKAKVQEFFKKEDGSFDETNFKKFYDNIEKEYQYMNAIGTENFILNSYEKAPGVFSIQEGQFIDLQPKLEKVDNPLDLSKGLVGFNEWSKPTKSAREAAQQNKYWDNDLQKWSDETVNKAGLLGLLTGKSLVYATYDNDVYDDYGQLIHQKGEFKKDKFGNYYAETTNDEENLEKQFVTWSEVVTDDNSPWNTIDIFDSDDLDSNIARSIFKGAALVGATIFAGPEATLLSKISDTIFLGTAAVNLATSMPQIAKSINAFFWGPESKTLNKWDNISRRFTTSQSDYSRDHFLSIENIINLATDSYLQLGQQRTIAMLPSKFMDNNKLEQLQSLSGGIAAGYIGGNIKGKQAQEMMSAVARGLAPYREAEKMMNKATKLSAAISRAYLVATSVQDVYNQSKIYGFDDQTAGLISLATYGAMGALFQSNYFRGYLYNSADWEAQRDLRIITRQYLQNNADALKREVAKSADKASKLEAVKSFGGKMINWIKEHAFDTRMGRHSIMYGAMGEGLEELSEEFAQDLSYQIGRSWQSVKSWITNNDYDNNYSYKDTDPLSRYAQSFFGGALGGAVFKIADRLKFDKAAYKHWNDLLNSKNNSDLMKEITYYISQGKTDVIYRVIDELKKTPIASTTISAEDGISIVEDPSKSQNAALFQSLKKAVNDIDTFLTNNNLKVDYERFGDIELIKGIRVAWLTNVANEGKGLHDEIANQYKNLINDIAVAKSEIDDINSKLRDNASEEEKTEAKENINKRKKIIDFKIQKVRDLLDGKDDSYIGRLMMTSNPETADSLAEFSKDAISKELYGMNYDELPTSYKTLIDDEIKNRKDSGITSMNYVKAWRTWKTLTADEKLKQYLKEFDEEMRNYKLDDADEESIKRFSLWAYLVQKYVRTLPVEARPTISQQRNFISKMSNTNFSFAYAMDGEDSGVLNGTTPALKVFLEKEDESGKKTWSFKDFIEHEFDNFAKMKSEDIGKKISEYKDGDEEITDAEDIFINIGGEKSLDEFKKKTIDILNKLQEEYNNAVEDDFLEDGILQELGVGVKVIKTPKFLEFIEKLDHMVNGDTSNLSAKLKEIIDQRNIQKNGFVLGEDQKESLNQFKKLMKLAKAIMNSSNEDYQVLLSGAPFGANNFLNKAFKEKELNIELSQISNNGSMHGATLADKYIGLIDNVLDTDKSNKEMLPKLEKLLEAKLYRDTRVRICSFLDKLKNGSNKQQELFNLLSLTFEGLGKDINAFMLKTPDAISVSIDEKILESELISFRNDCLLFESAFYQVSQSIANKGNDNYSDFVDTVARSIDKEDSANLYEDPATIDSIFLKSNTDEVIFCNDSTFYQYLMQCTYGNSKEALSAIKARLAEGTTFFPFGSQLDIAVNAIQFLCMSNPELNAIWLSKIKDLTDNNEVKNKMPVLKRGIKIICSGGTGKTEVILNLIVNAIQRLGNKGYIKDKIFFIANTERQLKNLVKGIDGDWDKNSILIKDVLSQNDEFWKEHSNGVFIIDEASILDYEALKKLDEICDKYNINYILSGDTKQLGANKNFENVLCAATKQLNESKRAFDNINRDNLKNLESMFSTIRGIRCIDCTKFKPFKYYDKDSKFSGTLFIDKSKNANNNSNSSKLKSMSEEDVLTFLKLHNIPKDAKILILSNDISILSNPKLKEYSNLEIENDVEKIQGISWDYVFNDLDLTVDGKSSWNRFYDYKASDADEVYSKARRVYTIMSRHRQGFISYKPLLFKTTGSDNSIITIDQEVNNEHSEFPPVPSGLLGNKEVLDDYIEFEKRVFNGLDLKDAISIPGGKTEAEKIHDPDVQNPAGKKEVAPVTTVAQNPNNCVQVASAFVPRSEFESGVGSKFGLTDAQYLQFRAIIYGKLTNTLQNADVQLDNLKPGLKNGKFYLKVASYKASELFDLASYGMTKETFTLQTDKKHLYIVYRIDDKQEIYLGQIKGELEFEKMQSIGNAKISVPAQVKAFQQLLNSASNGSYFELNNNVLNGDISRSQNIIDFRQIEQNGIKYRVSLAGGQLQITDSRISQNPQQWLSPLNMLCTSGGIFMLPNKNNIFRGRNPHVDDILTKLIDLKNGYSKIYEYLTQNNHVHHAGKANKYNAIFENGDADLNYNLFQEFLGVNTGSQIKKRGTPILNGKFVVFVKLNNGTNLQLIDALEEYNEFLNKKIDQVNALVEQLEIMDKYQVGSNEYNAAKSQVIKLIENRILQNVAPLAFEYPTLDTKNEGVRNRQIDTILSDLSDEEKDRRLPNGTVLKSKMRSYNYHVAEQLFTVLYACESLHDMSIDDLIEIAIKDKKSGGYGLNIKDEDVTSIKQILNEIQQLYSQSYGRDRIKGIYESIRPDSQANLDSDRMLRGWFISAIRKPIPGEKHLALQDLQNGMAEFFKGYYGIIAKNHWDTISNPLLKVISILNNMMKEKLGKNDYVPYLCENLIVDNNTYVSDTTQGSSGNLTVYTKQQINQLGLNSFKELPGKFGIQPGIIYMYMDAEQIRNLKPITAFGSGKVAEEGMCLELFNKQLSNENVSKILNNAKKMLDEKRKPSVSLLYELASIINQCNEVLDISKLNAVYLFCELSEKMMDNSKTFDEILKIPGLKEKIETLENNYDIAVPIIGGIDSRFGVHDPFLSAKYSIENIGYDPNISEPIKIHVPLIYDRVSEHVIQKMVVDTKPKSSDGVNTQRPTSNNTQISNNKETDKASINFIPDSFTYNESDLKEIKAFCGYDSELFESIKSMYQFLNNEQKEAFLKNFSKLKDGETVMSIANDYGISEDVLFAINDKFNNLCS